MKSYIGRLWHAVPHSLERGEMWVSVWIAALTLTGLGGYWAWLNERAPEEVAVTFPAVAVGGLLLTMGKRVWDADQVRLADFEAERAAREAVKPLRVLETAHDGRWRRLVIENPNSFPVSGCYVAVEGYRSRGALAEEYSLPSRGFRFAWGTWQKNPNGDLGAVDTLIVDLLQQPNSDHFQHVSHSGNDHQVVLTLPLPFGEYEIDVRLGARSTSIPVANAVLDVRFNEEEGLLLEPRL